MLESTRLAYLEAMGVVGWVPRQPLDNAAWRLPPLMPELADEPDKAPASPLPERSFKTRPRSPSTGSSPGAVVELIRARIAGTDSPRQQVPADPAAEVPVLSQDVPERAEPLEPFYLQLWQSGSCALLLEVHEPGLESASPELNLLRDILKAVQLPPLPALVSDFRWPLNRNPQLDRSAPAANRALQVFMQGRLEGRQVSSIGCFGRFPQLLLGPDLLDEGRHPEGEQVLEALPPAWFAPTLEQLLGEPRYKAQLWSQLQRIMHRWQGE